MLTGTVVFLVIGGIGLAVPAVGLIGGQLLGLLNAGIDATVSTETVAGFLSACSDSLGRGEHRDRRGHSG